MNDPVHIKYKEKKAKRTKRKKFFQSHPPLAIILVKYIPPGLNLVKSQPHQEGSRHDGSLHIPDMI